ncbi:hypothetical protein J3F83DRAFT_183603 [Trichoderma novae-zelandiae]
MGDVKPATVGRAGWKDCKRGRGKRLGKGASLFDAEVRVRSLAQVRRTVCVWIARVVAHFVTAGSLAFWRVGVGDDLLGLFDGRFVIRRRCDMAAGKGYRVEWLWLSNSKNCQTSHGLVRVLDCATSSLLLPDVGYGVILVASDFFSITRKTSKVK